MKITPGQQRRITFIGCLMLYAAAVLYAARADVPLQHTFFVMQVLSFITFVIATKALIKP